MLFRSSLLVFLGLLSFASSITFPFSAGEIDFDELEAVNPTAFSRHNITAADGINLEAIVFNPRGVKKNPAIVYISSWGLMKYEYLYPAERNSDSGYTVVSYTARGFWGSSKKFNQPGGEITLAGPEDIADVSTVIDWMIKNTNADPTKIGVSGISYGAGLYQRLSYIWRVLCRPKLTE